MKVKTTIRHLPKLFWLAAATAFVHVVVIAACMFLPAKELPAIMRPPGRELLQTVSADAKPSPLGAPVRRTAPKLTATAARR